MRLAFIGLGVMGGPMAGHLVAAGHDLAVFNRSPDKAWRFADAHPRAVVAASPSEAAAGRDAVLLCVGADDDVRAAVPAALEALAPGALIIDHTTASATLAREMAEMASAPGVAFIDAPVSGGQAGAEKGALTIMMGGEEAACDRAAAIVQAYAKTVRRIGGPGAGQLAKMANQLCIAGVVQGLAEAVHFTRRAGLDPDAVLAAIGQGAAQSWQMDNRWASMTESRYDFGFAVDWMRKDLGMALDEARRVGARLPLAALVDQLYADVQAMGGGRWDTSSLLARLEPPKTD